MQRVTNSMVQISTLADMHNNLNRLLKLQQQISSEKLYSRPSDNPVAVARELSLGTAIFENARYVYNMDSGVTLLENTESALDQITSIVQRIRELTIYAGNGALEDVDMDAIAQEIAELKEELRLTANYSVEGRYLLSGLATDTIPFQYDANGNVVYMGNDYNIYFETERGSEGKVSLNGLEVFPSDVTQYVLQSIEVPIDFEWSGRSEVLQFQVGDRTAKVLIPEKWTDDDGVDSVDDTDYNRFRDPNETEGYTLDEIAAIINSSLAMGDVGRLVSVEVVKDEAAGVQRLVIRSHTGEPVQLTSWPSTDAEQLSQGIEGVDVDLATPLAADGTLTFGWNDGTTSTIDVTTADSLQDIADRINAEIPNVLARIVEDGSGNGRLVVFGQEEGEAFYLTATDGAKYLFPVPPSAEGENGNLATPVTAPGTLTFERSDGTTSVVNVAPTDSLQDIVDNINAGVSGVIAAIVEDGAGNGRIALFNESGGTVALTPAGGATDLFSTALTMDPAKDLALASEAVKKTTDHSHIDLTSLFRMETTIKSTEVDTNFSIDTTAAALHWRLESGSNRAEILITDDANLTLEELATRIRNVAGSWLEVTVETDEQDQGLSPASSGGTNAENATQRLVIKTLDGESFVLYDKTSVAGADYASQLGVSTVTKGVTSGTFPSGSGLDETLPALVSVTVGDREYTVKLYRENVTTAGTNDLDGVKVAEEIVRQVNEQYGGKLLGTDDLGSGQFVLYSYTGEPLRITDLPFGDPDLKADEYGGGIALQLGLTTGVIGDAVSDEAVGALCTPGTFRISTLGRTVEIAVVAGDTPQTIAEKIRLNAGSWLDVSFVDSNMSAAGGTVQLALSAKDGSPVSVLDLTGDVAQYLGLDNTVRAELGGTLPTAGNLEITVDGYTHSIDLSTIRDYDQSGTVDFNDLVIAINNRFQGQDLRAELLDDGGTSYLALLSDQGYRISVTDTSGTLITGGVTTTAVRNGPLSDDTPYTQNVTVRTAANQNQTNFFGLLDDLTAAITSQDREGLSNSLLGKIDDFLDNLLRQRTEVGALVQRYEKSQARLTMNTTSLTELQSKVADTDLADAITKYQMAQAIYSASLAVIAQIIQPTLVDFLS
ncbi:flagellar hook-associated protein FlgL [Aminiphilus circumscriptus]|uniref:flagellar hook-associated protein FlgL n=1 Tax=Aminiphilus circumscriptus TaxID=290732 RepID=UPI0004924F4D|nr:flagellar hook-associated protein FlgL [Aminiphilus circumscriptus]